MQHSVRNADFCRACDRDWSRWTNVFIPQNILPACRVLGFGLGGAGALLSVLRVGHFDRRLALTRRHWAAPFIEALLQVRAMLVPPSVVESQRLLEIVGRGGEIILHFTAVIRGL